MRKLLTVVYTAALMWGQVALATQAIPTLVMPPTPTTASPTPVPTGPTPTPGTVGDPPTPHPTPIPTACTECTLTPTPTISPSATSGPTGTPTVAPSPTSHPCCLGIPGYILVPIVPGTQRGRMSGGLGPDICIQWRYDASHPTYSNPVFGSSSVYDEDFCVHYSQPVWQMEPQPFAVGPSALALNWSGIPGIVSSSTRSFEARFPLPTDIGACDVYTLTREVADAGNCNVVDEPVSDVQQITVCRPSAEWDCEFEWVESVSTSSTGASIVGAKYVNQHIFSYTSGCDNPDQLVGRRGSEEVDFDHLYTIRVLGVEVYREPILSVRGFTSGSTIQEIEILAHQPSQSYGGVSWPTNCHADAGVMDVYTSIGAVREVFLRDLSDQYPNAIMRHRYVAKDSQAMFIDALEKQTGTGVRCMDRKEHTVTIEFSTEVNPGGPIVPVGISAQLEHTN